MSEPTADQVYDVLVEECGASAHERARGSFVASFDSLTEYRFQGALGFGGKVWRGVRWNSGDWPGMEDYETTYYVTCYPEDETPERMAMVERANTRLRELP